MPGKGCPLTRKGAIYVIMERLSQCAEHISSAEMSLGICIILSTFSQPRRIDKQVRQLKRMHAIPAISAPTSDGTTFILYTCHPSGASEPNMGPTLHMSLLAQGGQVTKSHTLQ